jgi:flagellar hook-associated protein 3 FlgL
MLAGLDGFNPTFLLDLNITQNQIIQTNEQISSGYRVNSASDAPGDIASILNYQNAVAQITQVQTNLQSATTQSTGADTALSSANTLLIQLTSIAAQGITAASSATTNAILAQTVQGIEQQLVGLANTSLEGKFVFGGDDPSTQPYTFNLAVAGGSTAPGGVTQNNTAASTVTLTDSNGQSIVPTMTAQQIFDSRNADGTLAAGNIFQAAYALGQALQTNNQAGITAANDSLTAASTQLGTATTFYGDTANWIANATTTATDNLTTLQTEVSSLRDTDLAAAATDLATEQTALNAAVAAHGTLTVKSLFDYL